MISKPSIGTVLPRRCLGIAAALLLVLRLHAAEPAPLDAVVSRLAAEDFKERAAAGEELAVRASVDLEGVVRALFSEAARKDPEIRFQQDVVLNRIFERVVLGVGRPATGVKWARFLYIDHKKLPAALPMVDAVDKGSEGEKAGLKRGDVVWTIDGKPLPEGDALPHFRALLAETKHGEPLKLGIEGVEFGKAKHRVQKPKQPRKAVVTLVRGAPDDQPIREAKDGEQDRWRKELLARLGITP